MADEPDPEAGPVAVELSEAFLKQAERLKAPRRRDGASFWRLYRDLSDRQRFVERFIVQSWADYLRQRERKTVSDRQVETGLREHLVDGSDIETRHYLAER